MMKTLSAPLGRSILIRPRPWIFACFVAAALGGCANTSGYRVPISRFQDASSVVVDSARIYLTQLNKTERDAYIQRQANDNKPVRLDEIIKTESFSRDAIASLLQTLDVLSNYGNLLGQLANSDAPERISASAADLSAALERLSGTVNQLSGGSANNQFVGAIGPVTTLVGEVARLSVEKQIQRALDRAIQSGDGPVQQLINSIGKDIAIAYQRKRSSLSAQRTDYIDGYSDTVGRADRSERKQAARDLINYLDVWEAFPLSNPQGALDDMGNAFSALVTYAKSSKTPTDLASLTDQVELFAARAERVGKAVQKLDQNF